MPAFFSSRKYLEAEGRTLANTRSPLTVFISHEEIRLFGTPGARAGSSLPPEFAGAKCGHTQCPHLPRT